MRHCRLQTTESNCTLLPDITALNLHANANADDVNADADPHVDANTDNHVDPHTSPDTDGYINSHTEPHADAYNAHTSAHINSGAGADDYMSAHADADADDDDRNLASFTDFL